MAHEPAHDIDDDLDWEAEPNPEMVHWQPTHSPDGSGSRSLPVSPAGALGIVALGSVAVGAIAVGALAIGALAIGRLAVGRASFRRVEIDELVVGRVRFKD